MCAIRAMGMSRPASPDLFRDGDLLHYTLRLRGSDTDGYEYEFVNAFVERDGDVVCTMPHFSEYDPS